MFRYASAHQLIDVPNARSSHDVPTPLGGGIAIVTVVLCSLTLLWLWGHINTPTAMALIGGGTAVSIIGYWDDQWGVPVSWRLLIHSFAAVWAMFWVILSDPLLPSDSALIHLGWIVAAVVGIVWILNLYNFMDGIDGIAGIEAVTVASCAGALLWQVGERGVSLACTTVAAASLGFLLWNWPPAKIFMGDSGSGFLGFVFGVLATFSVFSGVLTPWTWLILLGAFIVDATLTLMRRIVRGEPFYQGHRNHAYQNAARRYGGHLPITLAIGAINVLWLFPLAYASILYPSWAGAVLLLAWFPLTCVALRFRAGLPE
jgi:Fuc2NAc and GlcNAc transferase